MSVTITIKDLVKKYGDTTVIPALSLEIKQGEFFTLLGPSGCGKATLLRMLAGFNSMEGGTIHFNERLINQVEPGKRNIGMVFQNYAIFPHLTVKGNIAFGLENRKLSKSEISSKVDDILKVVQIEPYKDRMPKNLSGGQQQRVALARVIVIRPDVLLMDEPLSNLDAKLRIDMRNAIKDMQREVGITTVYVTHDQEEAMAVSDRIAVMKSGIIQHLGTPQEIYQRPANVFVATFIGRTNIIEGSLSRAAGSYRLQIGSSYSEALSNIQVPASTKQAQLHVNISVRPEEFIMTEDQTGIQATIVHSVFLGQNTHYFVDLESEMNSFRYSYDRDTSYTFGTAIVKDKQTIGYLIYQLYESDMQKLIFAQNNEIAMITDEHNTIIATTSNVTKGGLNKFSPKLDGQGHVLLNGGKYYMVSQRIPDTPMQVIALNSFKSEQYTYYTVSVFVLVTSLLFDVRLKSRHSLY